MRVLKVIILSSLCCREAASPTEPNLVLRRRLICRASGYKSALVSPAKRFARIKHEQQRNDGLQRRKHQERAAGSSAPGHDAGSHRAGQRTELTDEPPQRLQAAAGRDRNYVVGVGRLGAKAKP